MSTAREPLTRDRVAAAALAFIDTHGVPALSMRKLGAELGVEAMSLYNHVESKDGLLDSVGNLLYSEVLDAYRPEPGWTWQEDARALAQVYREVALQHRNALSLMGDRVIPSAVKYVFLEQCYRIFTKAGFDTKDAALAFDTLASWVLGAIRQEVGIMQELAVRGNPPPVDGLTVDFQRVLDFAEACMAWTPDQRFDFGFDTMIAGFEVQLHRR